MITETIKNIIKPSQFNGWFVTHKKLHLLIKNKEGNVVLMQYDFEEMYETEKGDIAVIIDGIQSSKITKFGEDGNIIDMIDSSSPKNININSVL